MAAGPFTTQPLWLKRKCAFLCIKDVGGILNSFSPTAYIETMLDFGDQARVGTFFMIGERLV